MRATDRRTWAAARNLDDLGELTALWLEGQIESQPGNTPGYGPDPETEELIPVLAWLNRRGFVTIASQPGLEGLGYGRSHWQQRAAVSGFADDFVAESLVDGVRNFDLDIVVYPVRPRWRRSQPGVVVTTANGAAHTRFGEQLSAGQIAGIYNMCSQAAIDELCAAWQVTVYDPKWGRNDMWELLTP